MSAMFYGCMSSGAIFAAWLCGISACRRPQGTERRLEMIECALSYIAAGVFALIGEYVKRNPS